MGWWVVLVVGGLVASCGLFGLIRAWWLNRRAHSFPVLLREPGKPWRRGFAAYGERNMAWFALTSLSVRPSVLIPRAEVELMRQPRHDAVEDATVLYVKCREQELELLVSTADYAGLVSWVDSAPPKESTLY